MKVLKFGGSSIKTPERIQKVQAIIRNENDCKVVIVSAFGGVTNLLKTAADLASKGDPSYKANVKKIKQHHCEIIEKVCSKAAQNQAIELTKTSLKDLKSVLQGIALLKEASPKSLDYVLSFGEFLSSSIMSCVLENGYFVNAGDVMIADRNFGNARIDKKTTYPLLREKFSGKEGIAILGGFFGKTQSGEIVTMGRGASDYTAAIVAAAMEAAELQIWTDVSGFLSADPSKVEKAYTIPHLSFNEALELSHFGAKVLYPPAVQPVFERNIPIVVKNTFAPQNHGTYISSQSESHSRRLIKGISSIDDVALLNLSGTGMMGIMNHTTRLFGALAAHDVNVILISQGSSEFSISFAVNTLDLDKAKKAIAEEFKDEIKRNRMILMGEENYSIVAVVGENMIRTTGISGKLFNTLGRNGINIHAIAQGASELNISFVISENDIGKALNVIHDSFFLSEFTEQNIFLIGIGNVGKALIHQIKKQRKKFLDENQLKINIVGLANSKKYIFDKKGVKMDQLLNTNTETGNANLKQAVSIFNKMNLPNSVMVDCSASPEVATLYLQALDASISVVTANKIACSSKQENYVQLNHTAKKRGVKFLYETNVGAGLPILSTMRDLVNSGDKILKLEAVLSGTLNFIFNIVSADVTLSEAILQAKEKGYSEPDPRIDLSGIDVIRKLLILSRESGYSIEQELVNVTDFLPKDIKDKPTFKEFLQAIREYDAAFEKKRKKLEVQNKKWRYVARMENGKADVKLQEVNNKHPFFDLEGSNNIILITTERYKEHPMIIKGYGAGADVTASGVFADLMRVVNV